MGMFSWIDVTGKENIFDGDDKTIMLIPGDKDIRDSIEDFFDIKLDNQGISGGYDGYGRINGVDVYDVVAFLNICACNDEQFQTVYDRICEIKSKDIADEMTKFRQAYKEGFFNSPEDFWTLKEEFSLPDRIFDTEFRIYGIDLACYDEDNARLPYPIKLTVDETMIYENALFSMGDPNQGFQKTTRDRLSAVTYHEEDWQFTPEYIEGDEYNEETGEYEMIPNPDYQEPRELYDESDDRYEYDRIMELDELENTRQDILAEIRSEREEKEPDIER